MKKIFIVILAACLPSLMIDAKVQLSGIFMDNMVLQQNSDVAIWGTAEPENQVVITNTWSKDKVKVKAGKDGKWFARVATPQAGGPYELTVSDGEKLTLKNVLIGEVWICAGQSNMQMTMNGFEGQPVNGAPELIMTAKPSVPIRPCDVRKMYSHRPMDEIVSVWYENTPEGVKTASAVAYFFAKKLHEVLDVPVGVINISWGGTPIEAWMSPEVLKSQFSSEVSLKHLEAETGTDPRAPGVLYNGMVHPLAPFTAKGFIWYQGCDNISHFNLYKRLQPAFAQLLRDEWDNQDMGFYFTQIAPFCYDNPEAPNAGYMMWAQAQTLEKIPHSGMAATHDVGEFACIHPAEKKTVGDRLAYLALNNDYGYDAIAVNPPVYQDFEVRDGVAYVRFKGDAMGLGPIGHNPGGIELDGFELAGEDRVFHPAKGICVFAQNVIMVKCPEVPDPVAVRYGMKNWSVATVFNTYGIPVSPFRSDDW